MATTGFEAEATAQTEAAALAAYLQARDVPCPLCRYNLRGLTKSRCPECGRELQLNVGLVEPRIGAWVACLVALAGAAGLGVIAIGTLLNEGLPEPSSGQSTLVFDASFLYFIATVPAVAALVVLRRRYRRLRQGVQWALACAAVLLTALAFAGLLIH